MWRVIWQSPRFIHYNRIVLYDAFFYLITFDYLSGSLIKKIDNGKGKGYMTVGAWRHHFLFGKPWNLYAGTSQWMFCRSGGFDLETRTTRWFCLLLLICYYHVTRQPSPLPADRYTSSMNYGQHMFSIMSSLSSFSSSSLSISHCRNDTKPEYWVYTKCNDISNFCNIFFFLFSTFTKMASGDGQFTYVFSG